MGMDALALFCCSSDGLKMGFDGGVLELILRVYLG
jgi:hypothetical protein